MSQVFWKSSMGEWHCYGSDGWSLCGFFQLKAQRKGPQKEPKFQEAFDRIEACQRCWNEYQRIKASTNGGSRS